MSPEWIAVDWGTSNLRVWAMQGDQVLAEAVSDDGMGRLAQDAFEPALLRLIAPWLATASAKAPLRVIACGMVGSRQGWQEVPYRTVPCTALEAGVLSPLPTLDPRIALSIAPGLRQMGAYDVMRGEETQIAGAVALLPAFDGVFCLPGTHSKWVGMAGAQVTGFHSFMTGEVFALLSTQSVLRHGMVDAGWDEAAFDAGVAQAFSGDCGGFAALFGLRAEGLLAGLSAQAARARLSGLLIGTELRAARTFWQGRRVGLIGSPKLANLYARALTQQGAQTLSLDATDCTIAGLALARGPAA